MAKGSKTTKRKKITVPKYRWGLVISGASSCYETSFKTFPMLMRWVMKNKTLNDTQIVIERLEA